MAAPVNIGVAHAVTFAAKDQPYAAQGRFVCVGGGGKLRKVRARRYGGRAEVACSHGGGAQVLYAFYCLLPALHNAPLASTSVAPLARSMASGRCNTSARRGCAKTMSSKPMTFMARAIAPTLPAWLVLRRIKRVCMAVVVALVAVFLLH